MAGGSARTCASKRIKTGRLKSLSAGGGDPPWLVNRRGALHPRYGLYLRDRKASEQKRSFLPIPSIDKHESGNDHDCGEDGCEHRRTQLIVHHAPSQPDRLKFSEREVCSLSQIKRRCNFGRTALIKYVASSAENGGGGIRLQASVPETPCRELPNPVGVWGLLF